MTTTDKREMYEVGGDMNSPFMLFWWITNKILEDRNLPHMLYGEARDWYDESGLEPRHWRGSNTRNKELVR